MNVKELIKALQQFPENWDVCIGETTGDDSFHIKGIFDSSESFEGCGGYAVVQINPMPHGIDYWEFEEDPYCLQMYGDSNWYNTNAKVDIFKYDDNNECSDIVKARLNKEGKLILIEEE